MSTTVLTTEIPGIRRFNTGKVRDVYDLGDALLLVTTDRISAFDVIMPNGIPDKGRVLTQLSRYWFLNIRAMVSTHYITTSIGFLCDKIQERGGMVSGELREALSALDRAVIGDEPCEALAAIAEAIRL